MKKITYEQWNTQRKALYIRLLKQKKRTIQQDAFIVCHEGRIPTGALSRTLNRHIRD